MMALLIPYDSEPRIVSPRESGTTRVRAFTLGELQTIVGGFIEAVYLRAERVVMFINEDGKRLQLPLNYRATAIARQVIPADDYVVGHAILCTYAEAGQDDGQDGEEVTDGAPQV